MNVSLLQVHNEFATIALVVSFSYLSLIWLLSECGYFLRRFGKQHRPCARPGEDVHQALKLTGRLWDHYRTAALLFLVSFALLANFGRSGWWVSLSLPANIFISCAIAGVVIFFGFKCVQLLRYRTRLGRLLDQHNAVAGQLVEAQLRGNRVFHSVRLGERVLDNVVVGCNGVYTVQVFLPPPGAESVGLATGSLRYQPGGRDVPLQPYTDAVRALRHALAAEISSTLVVLPVVVIPDCRIEPTDRQAPMLVSPQTCMSFVGWQQKSAYLMDEDMTAISAWLAGKSQVNPPGRIRDAIYSLDRQVAWPGLIGN